MSPARKEDESVQTSLRELMRQEEDRLEQLRMAKARIDRERAEAAREAEEARQRREREEQADLDAKKAAAVERARIEALAKADAERRAAEAEERIRLTAVVAQTPPPKPSRFGAGFATGFAVAIGAAVVTWFALAAPRLAHAERTNEATRAELEHEQSRARDAVAANEAARADRQKEIDALRAENDHLRRAAESPRVTPKSNVPAPHPSTRARPACDPHDPLCGEL